MKSFVVFFFIITNNSETIRHKTNEISNDVKILSRPHINPRADINLTSPYPMPPLEILPAIISIIKQAKHPSKELIMYSNACPVKTSSYKKHRILIITRIIGK